MSMVSDEHILGVWSGEARGETISKVNLRAQQQAVRSSEHSAW